MTLRCLAKQMIQKLRSDICTSNNILFLWKIIRRKRWETSVTQHKLYQNITADCIDITILLLSFHVSWSDGNELIFIIVHRSHLYNN